MCNEENPFVKTVYHQYRAYLLRLWQETPCSPWRMLLQSVGNEEPRSFSDLESLFAYLQVQTNRFPEKERGPKEPNPNGG